ncbi:hypothetical protein GCM10009007_13260 [Formosimonas limnophila]|uniref:Uncharacterized protein n=1 Tax=Formosimonas limnophila TaxID=1384487 RepID=A0A8J3CLG2_9BURK|nr:hypothetical protein [Formosimonas limnophila]GHA73579.1 hypothetical protein GCM10009007_13260 [Formosimonas limnophila]
MAVSDLVGVPFPSTLSLFSDQSLQGKIRQIESYIEICSDLNEVYTTLERVEHFNKMKTTKEVCKLLHGTPTAIADDLIYGAVVKYAKAFTNSNGFTQLEKSNVFPKGSADSESHAEIMSLRNKFFAHRELGINHHKLYVIQEPKNSTIILNTSGQVIRATMSKNLQIPKIQSCVSTAQKWVQNKINDISHEITKNLSTDQITQINSISK